MSESNAPQDFDPVAYLVNLQHFGVKLGLERMQDLVKLLGNPQDKFPSIHIAGTNGKGSSSAMLASILRAQGLKVGLYTSPHLEEFTERIQINGKQIPDQELLNLVVEIKEKIERNSIDNSSTCAYEETTFFEFTTALAFLYFARQEVDIAIIEVGLGGRLDATNVVTPLVSVITSIDLDHTKVLGSTREEIAYEKAGIIKETIPLVCGEKSPELVKLFAEICTERDASFFISERECELQESSLKGQRFLLQGVEYTLGLLGEHQLQNALTVLKTVEILREQGIEVSDDAVQQGLLSARWEGRLQIYSEEAHEPLIILDGAHNPAGMQMLDHFLTTHQQELFFVQTQEGDKEGDTSNVPRKAVAIVGISTGKNVEWMLEKLSHHFNSIIVVEAAHRAIPQEDVAEVAKNFFGTVETCVLEDAMNIAQKKVGSDGFILVTGSLYVVGDILKTLRRSTKERGLVLDGAKGNV